MGILETLLVLFIVLKALGYIDWSWWLVFTPLIADVVLYIFLIFGGLAIFKRAHNRYKWEL